MRSLSSFNLATKIAIVGIALIVSIGVFSLTKRNLVYMMRTVTATTLSAQTRSAPYQYVRIGYIGEFGVAPTLPQQPNITHLPLVQRATPAAGSRPTNNNKYSVATISRPFIRVGLYTTEQAVKVKTTARSQIITTDGEVHTIIKKNSVIKLRYDRSTGNYTVRSGSWKLTTSLPVRVVPLKAQSIVTITNYENRPAWDLTLNDNEFYAVIELQYATATDLIWVINELGIENYVQGIGEAGNENDSDYLKALLTAARSYAYYQYLYPTKHADEPYLLDGTANDQVYRGYGFTKRAPNIVTAVKQTRGRIVEYNNESVVTPYFSRSDGRTRAWSEVWAGDQPHLLSVDDPCCSGETLLGHGVGMSAEGARYFAEDQGWDWKSILEYYYTDVTVPKLWE